MDIISVFAIYREKYPVCTHDCVHKEDFRNATRCIWLTRLVLTEFIDIASYIARVVYDITLLRICVHWKIHIRSSNLIKLISSALILSETENERFRLSR